MARVRDGFIKRLMSATAFRSRARCGRIVSSRFKRRGETIYAHVYDPVFGCSAVRVPCSDVACVSIGAVPEDGAYTEGSGARPYILSLSDVWNGGETQPIAAFCFQPRPVDSAEGDGVPDAPSVATSSSMTRFVTASQDGRLRWYRGAGLG